MHTRRHMQGRRCAGTEAPTGTSLAEHAAHLAHWLRDAVELVDGEPEVILERLAHLVRGDRGKAVRALHGSAEPRIVLGRLRRRRKEASGPKPNQSEQISTAEFNCLNSDV